MLKLRFWAILALFVTFLAGPCHANENNVIVLKKGGSLLRQIKTSNTTYVLKYKYNLRGTTLEIPQGCVLTFEGGSIKNGTIVLNQTKVTGSKTKKIFKKVSLKGKVKGDCYAEWFAGGIKIEKLLEIADERIVLNAGAEYDIRGRLVVEKSNLVIDGNSATLYAADEGARISLNGLSNITLCNLLIDGQNRTNRGVSMYNCSNVSIENVVVRNIAWDANSDRTYCYGIEIVGSHDVAIKRCTIEDVRATPTSNVAGGIVVSVGGLGEVSKNILVTECHIGRISSNNNGDGLGADCIVLSGRYQMDSDINAIIKNCTFYDFTKRAIKGQAGHVEVDRCNFFLTDFMKDKEEPKYVVEVFGNDSKITHNYINLAGKRCHVGIGVYSGGKTSVQNGMVKFDEADITSNVEILENEIFADQMTSGILIGVAKRTDCNLYRDVRIVNNLIRSKESLHYGVRAIDATEDCLIEGNIIENASIGIWLNSTEKAVKADGIAMIYRPLHKKMTIRNNQIVVKEKSKGSGVLFDEVYDSKILDNHIVHYANGIKLGGTNSSYEVKNCIFERNIIEDSSWGIETNNLCQQIQIRNNEFIGSSYVDMLLGSNMKEFNVKNNKTSMAVTYRKVQ